ncbi:class I poly(R)-hydroxyalkanoic acid synthase [Paracoccus sp. DMF]|uniref:class I poly(R)-hydroxyalkanoic acid synthase n=1 Tax=Paracoccus sp. DMF TaxID=400837 RepID=UPI0021E4AD76|nr:class I poly(R)-hydroxyalkanoic acid synthase [Paracoccus sp. DMF]MCV2446901.1 class I poly(R)-hydroxyalkanoic acid synthase [Paracoccus sp. DMF]
MAGKDEKPDAGTDAKAAGAEGKPRSGAAKTRAPTKTVSPATEAAPVPGDSAPAKPKPARSGAAKTPAKTEAAKTEAAAAPAGKPTVKPAAAKAAAAKSTPRNAAARARAAVRSDTRTGTRRKPTAKVAKADAATLSAADEALRPLGATGPAPAAEATPARAPAAGAAVRPAAGASDSAAARPGNPATVAFAEAAFGSASRLPGQLTANIERIESLTQRLIGALSQRKAHSPGVEMPGPDLFATATSAWMKLLAEQPERVMGQQVSYWGETLRHFAEAQAALARGTLVPPTDEGPRDRRFANPLWEAHPFFNFIKRQYQINAQALTEAASALDLPQMTDRRRVEWFTRQMIDMMAPTNFLATNPDALEKAVATEGESLVRGLENLVRDVENHSGELIVSLADRDAFRVGENIGTSAGTVVARTKLYELIQYKPTTESVHEIPLVIFPPWINKFYIMDLKPQNSLIKWIVDQGYTLFVVAWKNPDPSYGDTGMDDYVSSYLEIMDRVLDLTDQKKLNVVGYCIAGTTLALTLSLLKQRGDSRVNSATFFTTLTDFAEQGEFTAYLQDDFVTGIEEEAGRTGVLSAQLMTRTFSFLRANDLVWGPAIRSYMLGETPPAFDLLFWNGDGTNLPGRMAVEYLRGLCQQNRFVGEGFELMGHKLHISQVEVPLCAIACETDHIAPWRDSWRGIAQMGSRDKRFILSESGHIAGIINPPSKKKYGHYTSDAGFEGGEQDWRDKAQYHEGSWWGRWGEWLAQHAGRMVEAREPGEGFGPAPGIYVHERA